ncbi:MAG TPA: hypothetical protein VG488_04990, partial [Candidatus Angelobacter sp.]|nr:hypothetical protein [Candidatus Angelobacter sp.]
SILTVTTSSSTPAANSAPIITGSAGTLLHNTSVALSVQDFSVTPTAPPCIIAGSSVTIPVSLAPLNGFTGSASLSVSGLPTGASGSFNPNPVTISGTVTSTLTVTTSASTPGGNYPLTITVTSGGVTHAPVVTLCVENFTLTISPVSQNVNAGASKNYTVTVTPVNGFTGVVGLSQIGLPSGATPSFSPSSITITGTSGASSTLTVSTTNALAGAVYPFTVSGTAGSLAQSVSASLSVQNFTLSIAPSSQTILVGASATYTVTVTPVNGYTGTLNCSVTGLPTGATAICPAITITSSSGPVSATLTITTTTSTPPVNVVFTVTYTDTSGAPSHSVTPSLSTQNFTCSISPASQQVVAGSSVTYTLTVASLNGFSSPVNFAVSGLPSGATGSFNPNPLTGGSGTSILTVNTSTSTPLANGSLTITCSSGPISQQLSVSLQVVAIQILRPTTFSPGCFCADYTNAANATDGNLATFASGPTQFGTGAFTADNYSGFGSPSRPPIAINLKVSSAYSVGNNAADMVTMDYSTDGGSTLHSIYDVFGSMGPSSRGQLTDVVSLPINTNLANVMVDASVNNGGTSTHTINDIWIEIIHQ